MCIQIYHLNCHRKAKIGRHCPYTNQFRNHTGLCVGEHVNVCCAITNATAQLFFNLIHLKSAC